ncbi:hypothetical protein [Oligella urethralis]|uniref:hypothetical protein n=1 Tax=Oligella urethralis TaxID=90245 RepID=UPI00242BAA12|nr:hypothetical protein [Oligella urethralis]
MLSTDEVKVYITKYVEQYPVSKHLHFKVRNTPQEFEHKLSARYEHATAAYYPYKNEQDNRHGCIDVVANHHRSYLDLRRSLNHEILGHYGLNILTPENKKQLLDGIIANQETLFDFWDEVNRMYKGEPLYLRAEEVFCLAVEDLDHSMHADMKHPEQHSLSPLTVSGLKNIALDIANGISNNAPQRTFLHEDITYLDFKAHKEAAIARDTMEEFMVEVSDDFER